MLTNMPLLLSRRLPRNATPIAAVVLAMLWPAAAQARVSIRVGIGDQHAEMFGQSAFQRAKFQRARYVLPWNVMDTRAQRLAAARTCCARGSRTSACSSTSP